jgi:DNA-binding MarR family transcriptional regulator
MGRYRGIVAALVRHGNMAARSQFARNEIYPGLSLTHQEWQVLEYIIEHETDDETMTQISERLAIPQSSFSKISKMLFEEKLIARYRVFGNRKNIVLKATPYGKEIYASYSQTTLTNLFHAFFESLSEISDADLAKLSNAIEGLDQMVLNSAEKDSKKELIEIDS